MSHQFVTRSHTMRRNTCQAVQRTFKWNSNCLCKSNINETLSTWRPMFTVGISICHKKTSFNPFFSYFTLAGNSEERLTGLIYKLKTTFVTCTIELDLCTSNRSNLCFDFAVVREHLCPVLKRPEKTYGGFPRNRTNFTPH